MVGGFYFLKKIFAISICMWLGLAGPGIGKAESATKYGMQTFKEFLDKKNETLFPGGNAITPIKPFTGLFQPRKKATSPPVQTIGVPNRQHLGKWSKWPKIKG